MCLCLCVRERERNRSWPQFSVQPPLVSQEACIWQFTTNIQHSIWEPKTTAALPTQGKKNIICVSNVSISLGGVMLSGSFSFLVATLTDSLIHISSWCFSKSIQSVECLYLTVLLNKSGSIDGMVTLHGCCTCRAKFK